MIFSLNDKDKFENMYLSGLKISQILKKVNLNTQILALIFL